MTSALRTFAGLAGIGLITVVFRSVVPANAATAGFAYLLTVLGLAITWGRTEAIAASIAAVLCYNFFFLPPVGRFTIADPQNWVALLAFLVTSLVASHLSARIRQQAADAIARQRESEQLYTFSRAILLIDSNQAIGPQVAQQITQIFHAKSVALLDLNNNQTYGLEVAEAVHSGSSLRQAALEGKRIADPLQETDIWPVTLGGKAIGSLRIQGVVLSEHVVRSLLNLVAIALERVHTQEAANQAELLRQREEFKSTMLDAVAHEFKTPLTSIKAASTSILSNRSGLSGPDQELLTIIDEEADRLNLLVSDAVAMARVDAGKLSLQKSEVSMDRLIRDAVDGLGPQFDNRILYPDSRGAECVVLVDPELIPLSLRQLMDNALKYSPPGSPIDISFSAEDSRVIARVKDRGMGIPDSDKERIFEKFYRHPDVRSRIPGSGLGLRIAREIVRLHGGDLWVEPNPGGGSIFCMALPFAAERQSG